MLTTLKKYIRRFSTLIVLLLFSGSAAFSQVSVELPDRSGQPGDEILVPVQVSDLTGQEAHSIEFTVEYDADVINITGAETEGTITEDLDFEQNSLEGEYRFTGAKEFGSPFEGEGDFVLLEVELLDPGETALEWENFELEEGEVESETTNGSIIVADEIITVELPEVTGQPNVTDTIAVSVGDLTDNGVYSFEFDIEYDSEVVQITDYIAENTIADGLEIESNFTEGFASLAAASDAELAGEGDLIHLEVEYQDFGDTPLTWDKFLFNEGNPGAERINGHVDVPHPTIDIVLPDETFNLGDEFTIPITIDDLTDEGVFSYQFNFDYDSDVVEFNAYDKEGTVSEDMSVEANFDQNGNVSIAAASDVELEDEGVLLYLEGSTEELGSTDLTWSDFQFNEGTEEDPIPNTIDGSIMVPELSVFLPEHQTGLLDETVLIPVTTEAPADDVFSYDFSVSYDSELLEIVGIQAEGTLSEDFTTEYNSMEGMINVAGASDEGFQEEGTLIYLEAELNEMGTSELVFESFDYDEGALVVATHDGSIEIVDVTDLPIEFANIQWPFDAEITSGETDMVYSRVWIDGATDGDDELDALTGWIGINDENTDPSEWDEGAWSEMDFNADGSDAAFDEYMAELDETNPGEFYYATRYQNDDGDYVYGGISDEEDQLGLGDDTRGGFWDGDTNVSGELTVHAVEVENIAELLEVGDVGSGTVYTVTDEVYLTFNSEFRNRKVVVDPTGGIVFDDDPGNLSTDFNRYDGLTGITGSLAEFNGLIQFEPVEDMEASSSDNNIYPNRVSNLAEADSSRQGELVYIENVTFQETGEFEDGTNYTIEDEDGNELTMRTDRVDEDAIFDEGEESIVGTAIPQEPVNLIGYMGMFYDPQLVVRKLDDINDAEIISEFDLTAPGDGETVLVEGPENEEISITWDEAESDYDVNYQWISQTDGLFFTPPVLEFASDDDGSANALTFTISELDEVLEQAGLGEGDQITLDWTVAATESDEGTFRYANQDWTVTFERGEVTSSGRETEIPNEVALDQNYPNPFNPSTTIQYELPNNTDVTLTVYDVLGQKVATLVDENVEAGTHEVNFNASELSSGVYIYRLQAGDQTITRQMSFVK